MKLTHRSLAAATAVLLGAPLLAVTPAQAADDVTLNLIGINDFHGRIDANTVKFAGTVEQVRQQAPDSSLLISAGDNVSASLFASAVQGDIPTIDVLNALHLDASAAGNHEFDKGAADLTGRLSDAADFPFLAANVFKADNTPAAQEVRDLHDRRCRRRRRGSRDRGDAFPRQPGRHRGADLRGPDRLDQPDRRRARGAGRPAGRHRRLDPRGRARRHPDARRRTPRASPVFKKIVEQTDPAVDAIFMGHTHQAYAYDAPIPGEPGKTRPVLQTGNYGSNVGNIKLTFDKDSGTVTSYEKSNVARTTTADSTLVSEFPRVAAVKPIVDSALAYADTIGKEPIGKQTADITRAFNAGVEDRGGESTLGNLVGDSLLAKVKDTPAGADIGVTNPGGLRTDLLYAGTGGTNADGVITYAEANSVLPFANTLATVTLTGASFTKVLEQQWQRAADGSVPTRAYLQLGLSRNVHYTFDPTLPEGSRITSVTVNGAPLDPAKSYKVAVPSFLATGGDNFRAFKEGTSVDTGLLDYEAWIDYLRANAPVVARLRASRRAGRRPQEGVRLWRHRLVLAAGARPDVDRKPQEHLGIRHAAQRWQGDRPR